MHVTYLQASMPLDTRLTGSQLPTLCALHHNYTSLFPRYSAVQLLKTHTSITLELYASEWDCKHGKFFRLTHSTVEKIETIILQRQYCCSWPPCYKNLSVNGLFISRYPYKASFNSTGCSCIRVHVVHKSITNTCR